MNVIFMSFSRNIKKSRKRKTEITGKYNRKALADGWIEQARQRKERVPDTAHDCPIFRIGVMQEQPVSERENLSKWELFSFFHSQFLHHKTTVIYILV